MKTERVTLLASPEFKAFLGREARREGVSVSELVRTRCERRPTEAELTMADLVLEVGNAVRAARASVKSGIAQAEAALTEIREARAARTPAANDPVPRIEAKTPAKRSASRRHVVKHEATA